jgi:hypothetical protein
MTAGFFLKWKSRSYACQTNKPLPQDFLCFRSPPWPIVKPLPKPAWQPWPGLVGRTVCRPSRPSRTTSAGLPVGAHRSESSCPLPPAEAGQVQVDTRALYGLKPCSSVAAGLTKRPVQAGDQGACSSADPSSFVPSQDGSRSSAPFAGPQLDLEAALSVAGVSPSAFTVSMHARSAEGAAG